MKKDVADEKVRFVALVSHGEYHVWRSEEKIKWGSIHVKSEAQLTKMPRSIDLVDYVAKTTTDTTACFTPAAHAHAG